MRKIICLLTLLFIIQSCASYREYLSKEAGDWPDREPDPTLQLEHRLYLIGDAGNAAEGRTPPALALLREQLADAGENSTVVFLGDNIYPDGMAPKMAPEERARDEYRLQAQLDAVKDFPGRIFFIAGNHDWYGYGVDGLDRQRKFIEKYLDRDDIWEPDCGCGDPKEVELGENLVLVLVDSQWYLGDWEGEPEINDGCEVKSHAAFRIAFEEAIKGSRNKNVIVAVHHPPYTYGPHGGRFTAKEHLFPLTALNDNLYLPLPGLGSAFAFLRGAIGHRQDAVHPKYRELSDAMLNSARKNGSFIFASGHEHSLQYIERDDQHFVVSGAGSKRSATGKGEGLQYAYGQHGFVQLDVYEDGSVWTQYWVAEDGGRVAFRTQVKGPLPILEEEKGGYDFTLYKSRKDTVMRQLDDRRDYTRSGLGEFLWGKHYREAYDTKIAMPLLDLAEYQGGVEPVKQGGGYQTNSLRLEDEEKRQYNMRSIAKDATRVLPYPLNESFALGLVQDAFTSAHPLAALALPRMAEAVGIYYPVTKLYFTPRQPRLGKYNESYGNEPYQVEERPDDRVWGDYAQFGYSDDIVSTQDMLENIHDDHDHLVDQSFVLRNRIFDILIGDWDRHDDQWRWATIEEDDKHYYRPIPRDRDQAFSKYDGFLLSIVHNTAPPARPLRPYVPYPRQIQWSNFGSRYFDGSFLTDLGWEEWEKHAHDIQRLVTDEVIEEAFREGWPEKIYERDAPEIIAILKERRTNLVDLARDFYEVRARKVDVVGTNKKDLFEVERMTDGRTRVRMYDTNGDGDKEELLYDRTFLPEETREVSLYGLDDEDFFIFLGEGKKGVKVRAVGGLDEDYFLDESRVRGWGKKTIFYDFVGEDNEVTAGPETRRRFTRNPVLNTYNRKAPHYDYNWGTLFPSVSFNPDDGFLIGFFGQRTYYGFMKDPYASVHNFSGSFALATQGYTLDYQGEFMDVFGKWEFALDARLQSERYSINFYGFGNDSTNPEDSLGLDYNRVRQGLIDVFPGLMRRLNSNSALVIGPTFESFQIERTEGRFLDENAEALGIDPQTFKAQDFAGLRALFNYRNQNDPTFPTRGLAFSLDAGWKRQLQNAQKNFAYLNSDLTVYQNLTADGNLVLASRVGVRHNFDEDGYEFYQGATLGGIGPRSNFRGFRRDRFNGTTAFFHNTDLRLRLLTSRNRFLPFSFGLLGGFDHGRVWLDDEESDTWHYSYGGGVFFTPLNLLTLHFSLFRGDNEVNRFTFGGKFFF